MTSAMRQTLSRMTGRGSESDSALMQEADKYRLLVTAGPSYDQEEHQVVPVNTDTAITVENELVTAKILVRVRGFRGLPSVSPASSQYFDDPIHERDQYSLGFSFVPKKDIPSLNTVWGNDFDHPIRNRIPPPFIINTAFRIVKEFIDPGLDLDAYADEPWVYGPSLSCWFGLRIGDKVEPGQDFPAPDNVDVLKEGADGSGQEVREALNLPENNEKRRKYFLDAHHRESFVFEKGRCYQGDFYNPYIDFGNFLLKLPGFSLKVIKYVEEKTHCLRYVFKDRQTGDMFFNVNFHLLWGEQLKEAKEADKEYQAQTEAGSEVSLRRVVIKKASPEIGSENDEGSDTAASTSTQDPATVEDKKAATTDPAHGGIKDVDEKLRNTSLDQKRASSDDDELD